MNYHIVHLDKTDSTNRLARTAAVGDVIVAREQTAGRGRLDHRWTGAPGANLMFSLVVDLADLPIETAATLPLLAGLAVAEALDTFAPRARGATAHPGRFALKWPNDIYCNNRKLCGILCERVENRGIVGIGLNVNETSFPAEIALRAVSLRLVTGRTHDLDAVLAAILAHFDALLPRWRAGGFAALHTDYAARDCLKGRELAVRQTDTDTEPLRGLCRGVQSDGTLLVGDVPVYAGEAHIL